MNRHNEFRWQGPWCGRRHLQTCMLAAIQIGNDPGLLRSRGAVLETAGLRVVSVDSFVRAMEKILTDSFGLAILCHSLPRTDRLNLTAAIRRRHPSALVLLVSGGRGASTGEEDGMDAVLEAEPRRLLHSLRDILRSRRNDGAAQPTEEACQA